MFRHSLWIPLKNRRLSKALPRNCQSLAPSASAIRPQDLGPCPAARDAAWSWRCSGLQGRGCHTYSDCLVVDKTPLKNMSSSIGMMNFPIFLGKYSIHVPGKPPTSQGSVDKDCCLSIENPQPPHPPNFNLRL